MKTFGNKASFVALNGAILTTFDAKHALTPQLDFAMDREKRDPKYISEEGHQIP